jgi:hypothetical protein
MWEQKKENKPDCVTICGRRTTEQEEVVYLDYYVMGKINYLMKKYHNLEWLAYLIGKDNVVEDFYIPTQKVTTTNVSDIEGNPGIEIIGVIHSHHNLGLHSFSGTDHAYINDNHDLSILVWHGGMNGQKRIKLSCGATMIVPIRIEFFHPDINEADLEKESEDNISEKKYVYTTPVYTPGAYTYQPPLSGEKKTENGGNNRNAATGKTDPVYEKYLDQLVYDDENLEGLCVEDLPVTDDFRSAEEIEAHFQRIEERECNMPLLPRGQTPSNVPGFAASAKISVGPWEV